jgi:hypothetical protein
MDAQPETRLDLDAFVREAETSVERFGRLVEIGALVPVDGTFSEGDVVRPGRRRSAAGRPPRPRTGG